jgi:hypothetical protein
LLAILIVGVLCIPIGFGLVTGELWSTGLSGAKVIALSTVSDANGDGHEDVVAATKNSTGGMLYLLNGMNGTTIQSQSLNYVPLEVLCITSPSLRIAVAVFSSVCFLLFSLVLYYSHVLQIWRLKS